VLVILAVVAGIAAVIYAILWVWPYILFYVLPLAAASLLYGGIFWLCTRPSETDAGEVKAEFRYSEDKCYKPLYQYRSLLVAFPSLVLVNLAVFHLGAPEARVVEVDTKERVLKSRPVVEWEWANRAFNDTRRSAYADSWFDALKAAARHDEVYDRRDIGGIFWFALIMGGPLVFLFWFGKNDELEESKMLYKHLEKGIQHEKDILRRYIEEQEKLVKDRLRPQLERIAELERARSTLLEENRVLKAKVEFSKDVPKPSESKAATKGVLDADIL
jgi:hypothetical protein